MRKLIEIATVAGVLALSTAAFADQPVPPPGNSAPGIDRLPRQSGSSAGDRGGCSVRVRRGLRRIRVFRSGQQSCRRRERAANRAQQFARMRQSAGEPALSQAHDLAQRAASSGPPRFSFGHHRLAVSTRSAARPSDRAEMRDRRDRSRRQFPPSPKSRKRARSPMG